MTRRTVAELLQTYTKTASEEAPKPVQSALGNALRKVANDLRNKPKVEVSLEVVHYVKQAMEQGLQLNVEDPKAPKLFQNKVAQTLQKVAFELRKSEAQETKETIKTAQDVLAAARGLTLLGALREDSQ